MSINKFFAIMTCFCAPVLGQSAPAFEVASIRVQPGPVHNIGISTSGSRFQADAYTVFGLILYAYNLKEFQLSIPVAVSNDRTMFDIVAKAGGEVPPSKNDFRKMVQALLADRFKLKFHRESRELPVYALEVGKGGVKFKESAPEATPVSRFNGNGKRWQLVLAKQPVDDLVEGIMSTSALDRPVVNKTNLGGYYDIKLTYTPEDVMSDATAADVNAVGIFSAVQDQLGLKLEPQKGMFDVLIVDHIEKPSDN
jgi:uncharacterized protein (TIGR03435 family)